MLASLSHLLAPRVSPPLEGIARAFSKVRNFRARFPELYAHVHPDSLPLFEKPWVGSEQVVKWVCDKGPDHVWTSPISKRIRSYKQTHKCICSVEASHVVVCLYCLGRKVSVTNSLASRYPELAKEWCYEKNGDLTPNDITYGSSKNVWWRCSKNPEHVYYTSPNDRTYAHRGCPYCNNMLVCSTNNLAVTHPDIAKQWYQEKNGELTPDQVLPSYTGKVWWQCSENPEHVRDCPVNYRVRFHWGCPYCQHKRFDDFSLSSLYPSMARDWDYAKNGKDTPYEVSPNSEKIVYWKCEHGVEWKQSVVSRKHSYLNGYHRCMICRERLQREMEAKQDIAQSSPSSGEVLVEPDVSRNAVGVAQSSPDVSRNELGTTPSSPDAFLNAVKSAPSSPNASLNTVKATNSPPNSSTPQADSLPANETPSPTEDGSSHCPCCSQEDASPSTHCSHSS